MATSVSPVASTYPAVSQPQARQQVSTTTSISPATATYPAVSQPQVRHQISTTLRRSMALLAPNARGSLKRASKVTVIAAEDIGIGHSVAVLYAADGSGVAVVRLPRGR